jgi:hypothetical protein
MVNSHLLFCSAVRETACSGNPASFTRLPISEGACVSGAANECPSRPPVPPGRPVVASVTVWGVGELAPWVGSKVMGALFLFLRTMQANFCIFFKKNDKFGPTRRLRRQNFLLPARVFERAGGALGPFLVNSVFSSPFRCSV